MIPLIEQNLPSKFHFVMEEAEWPQLKNSFISPVDGLDDVGLDLLIDLTASPRGRVVVENAIQRSLLIRSLLKSLPNANWAVVCQDPATCDQLHQELHGDDMYCGKNVFMHSEFADNAWRDTYDALLFVGAACGVMPEITGEYHESTAVRYAIAESEEDALIEVAPHLYAKASDLLDIYFGPRLS